MHSFLAVAGVVVVYVMDGHSDMCRSVKILGFLLCILQSIFIIASRKHYSVDIVIAWYVNQLILWLFQSTISCKRGLHFGLSGTL